MRYSTVPAINLEQHVARNRELIANAPAPAPRYRVWSDGQWIVNPQLIAQ